MPDVAAPLPGKLVEAFQAALDALEEAHVEYAILGGIAANLHGLPRLTMDVDVLVRAPRIAWPGLLGRLEARGYAYGRQGGPARGQRDALEALARDGLTEMWRDGYRLDLLNVADPIHGEALGASRRTVFLSRSVPVIAPEHLILTKWIAGRPKDLLDVDAILAVQRERLDLSVIRAWLPAIERSGGLKAQEFEDRVRRILGG